MKFYKAKQGKSGNGVGIWAAKGQVEMPYGRNIGGHVQSADNDSCSAVEQFNALRHVPMQQR